MVKKSKSCPYAYKQHVNQTSHAFLIYFIIQNKKTKVGIFMISQQREEST